MTENFELQDWRFNWLRAEIERLNKRSKRCGGGLSLVVESEEVRRAPKDRALSIGEDPNYMAIFYTCRIEGETPCRDGFTPIATVDFIADDLSGGRSCVVRNFLGQELPQEYREATQFCDHCQTMRVRNSVTFLREDETGAIIQVGRNCLADFLRNPEMANQLAAQSEFLTLVSRACSEGENGINEDIICGGGGYNLPSLLEWIRWTVAIVNVVGFVSRGRAYDDPTMVATSEIVSSHLFSRNWKPEEYIAIPSQEDTETAQTMIAWAQELSCEENDYLGNLKAIARRNALDSKHYGLATSLPTAYLRAQEKLVRQDAAAQVHVTQEWYGSVGDKVELADLEIVMQRPYESEFGYGCMYKFNDSNGHIFVWFSSSNKNLENGSHVSLKGSIKKFGEYGAEKQTVLTRCRVKELQTA